MPTTLDDLRHLAVTQSLFTPTTLKRALHRFGFVQADPIRAPARAQDLILRHRVKDYRAGDLERRYTKLGVEEDFFINYGFVPRSVCLGLPHSGSGQNFCWSSYANAERCTRVKWMRISRTVG